ncbi:MAG: CBS domain-containing protein [candidate division Zixibacteria bacterium]|nr:CBS domain-containing protein [candidate division Zixibacteria bacterium]
MNSVYKNGEVMENKLVRDLMVPIEEYAVVDETASLHEAFLALDNALMAMPAGRQPYRAVLVQNAEGKVVGKIGQLSFLKALEPKYDALGDVGSLSRAGVSAGFISSMMDHYRFFQDDIRDMCTQAKNIKVTDAMHTITEKIDADSELAEAMHKIVMFQTLSILVVDGEEVVGLLRLADLFDEIAEIIRNIN